MPSEAPIRGEQPRHHQLGDLGAPEVCVDLIAVAVEAFGELDNTIVIFTSDNGGTAEGVDVGVDRRSPVHWGVFERHGPFPYAGHLIGGTYTPGQRADYDTRLLAEATRESTRVYE